MHSHLSDDKIAIVATDLNRAAEVLRSKIVAAMDNGLVVDIEHAFVSWLHGHSHHGSPGPAIIVERSEDLPTPVGYPVTVNLITVKKEP